MARVLDAENDAAEPYCKDANRRGDFPNQSFDFLGFSVLQAHTERSSSWTDQSCG